VTADIVTQTVAELKVATPPGNDLWSFLMQLPTTHEAQVWYALLLGGIVGMIGHYIRGRAANNIGGNPIDYFFRDNVWRSIGAMVAVASELFGEVGSGLFTTDAGAFVGWGLVLLSGLKTGYLGDSLVNKATRPEWPPEKREAAIQEFAKEIPPVPVAPPTVVEPAPLTPGGLP